MKKLPNVYQVPINKEFTNNEVVYHTSDRVSNDYINKKDIYKIFTDAHHVYKTRLEITKRDGVSTYDVVGIKDNKLLTIDNHIINIDDIIKIKKV